MSLSLLSSSGPGPGQGPITNSKLNKLKSLKVAQVQGCVGDGVCVMLCDDAVCDVVCNVVCDVV